MCIMSISLKKMDESINTQRMIFTFGDMFLQKKTFCDIAYYAS
jgi:hypothetical protein